MLEGLWQMTEELIEKLQYLTKILQYPKKFYTSGASKVNIVQKG